MFFFTISSHFESSEHIRKTLSGDISDSCVFLDTQSSLNHSMQCNDEDGGGMSNDGEAKIISGLCKRFIQVVFSIYYRNLYFTFQSGVKSSEIGVMSAYRKQVDHIKTVVQNDSLEVSKKKLCFFKQKKYPGEHD